jgi:hypothetical protein
MRLRTFFLHKQNQNLFRGKFFLHISRENVPNKHTENVEVAYQRRLIKDDKNEIIIFYRQPISLQTRYADFWQYDTFYQFRGAGTGAALFPWLVPDPHI